MILVEQNVGLGEVGLFERVALRREPVRPLPAVNGAEHGARSSSANSRASGATDARDTLLVGVMHGEDLGVGLLVFLPEIPGLRVGAKAARIDAEHVDRRLAFHDPLGELPAGAAGRGDAERVPFIEPEVAKPGAGPTIGEPSGV